MQFISTVWPKTYEMSKMRKKARKRELERERKSDRDNKIGWMECEGGKQYEGDQIEVEFKNMITIYYPSVFVFACCDAPTIQ